MKKGIYIISFTFLGILFQFLLHALIEKWYIQHLISDFGFYSLGFSWSTWFLIHHIATIILFLAGAAFGMWGGIFFWPKLYDEQGNVRKWLWKKIGNRKQNPT